jgi:hypothetical protein
VTEVRVHSAPRAWAAVALGALLLPIVAAAVGPLRPRPVRLNLGPGDGPYIEGFAAQYEIDDKVGTHWTTYHAAIRLPVRATGPAVLRYRYARVFPQTAQVTVGGPAGVLETFEARGGVYQERAVPWPASTGPVVVRVDVDSHERQDRGLRLDWVRLEPLGGTRFRLSPSAWWAAPVLAVLFGALLALAGWSPMVAAGGAALVGAILAAGLLADPWIVHRMLRGVPLALALFGAAGVGLGRWLVRRGRVEPGTLRTLTALGLAAFLVRAAAVGHPDFYYPDLRTHARLVEFVARGGLGFFVHPSHAIEEHGVWFTGAYGRKYAFPYTPAFHLPFAALSLPYDTRIVAMKLFAVALSIVPLPLSWAVARRWGIAPLGAALLAVVPTYTSRLSFAFLPALLGHAVDLGFIAWMAARLGGAIDRATWLRGAGWVAACQLAYVSGVINTGALVAALALLALPVARRAPRDAIAVALMGAAGALVAFLLFYRDFLPMVQDVAARAAAGGAAASRYPVQSFLVVAYARTRDFFDGVYPVLAALGFVLLWRRGEAHARWIASAWGAAYVLLLLGRAKLPDLFLHGHETLLATPLVCLLAGEALAASWARGGAGRAAAAAALAVLAAQGLAWQWRAIADQLANAL